MSRAQATGVLALVAVALTLPAVRAATIAYTWDTILAKQPMPNVQCGDIISISWPASEMHGVFKLNDEGGACPNIYDNSTGVLLVAPSNGGNCSYTIKIEQPFWLVDPVSTSATQSNCNAGYAIMYMTSCPSAGNAGSPMPSPGMAGMDMSPGSMSMSPATAQASQLTQAPPPASSSPPATPSSAAAVVSSVFVPLALLLTVMCLQHL